MLYNAPYGVVDTDAAYINGDPSVGRAGSIPPAASIEYPQREIVNFETDAGLTPSNSDLHQLAKAVQCGGVNYAVDSGTAGAMAIALTPPLLAHKAGMEINVKVAQNNPGAATIFVNALAAKSVVRGDGTALNPNDLQATRIARLIYDGTYYVLQPGANDYLIDSQITFTVHGAAPDFADLNIALQYLSKYRISHNGQVTLQLRAGAFNYTSTVYVNHPNNDRILILGATMLASCPTTDAGFTLTGPSGGQRASDNATNIAMLRTKFATELHFSNNAQFEVDGQMLAALDALLFTGDGTAASGVLFNCGPTTYPNRALAGSHAAGLAAYGYGAYGFVCANGGGVILESIAPIVAIGNNIGFGIHNNGIFCTRGNVLSLSNIANGMTAIVGTVQLDGNFYCECNGALGVGCYTSRFLASVGNIWKNSNTGFYCVHGSQATTQTIDYGAAGNVNGGAGTPNCSNGSIMTITGSTNYSGSTPAVNVEGNANSLIVL